MEEKLQRFARATDFSACEVIIMKKAAVSRSPRPDYADAADFLRVASVGIIGWYHIWQQSWLNPDLHIGKLCLRFYPIVACGYMFVDLMLLLSGFLLMLGFLNKRDRDPLGFYRSRAARILPSYLFCLAVVLFVFDLPARVYPTAADLRADLLPHLGFIHNFFYKSYIGTKLNGALWTLAVEVQFYLLFPLLARAFMKKPALTYGCMTVFALAVRFRLCLLDTDTGMYFNHLGAMLDVYANGMLAANVYYQLRKTQKKAWRVWLSSVLCVAACVGIYLILSRQLRTTGPDKPHRGQMTWRYPLSALGAVFLVCGSRSIRPLRALFSNPITRFLSGISFNFYIWHQFLAVQLKKWRIPAYTGDAPNMEGQMPWQHTYTLVCFAAALLAAFLVTYLIEKPCARFIKKHLKRDPARDRIGISK